MSVNQDVHVSDQQLQKLYDLETALWAQVRKEQAATVDMTAAAAQLLACLVEQNALLGLHK